MLLHHYLTGKEQISMTITKNQDGEKLLIALEGRLDTTTAPNLEAELKTALNGITSLTFDLKGLEYISSAGLRVLLSAQKTMNKQYSMLPDLLISSISNNVNLRVKMNIPPVYAGGMTAFMLSGSRRGVYAGTKY